MQSAVALSEVVAAGLIKPNEEDLHHLAMLDEIVRLRDEVNVLIRMALETWELWDADQDARVGKMLKAMADLEFRRQYRPDLTPNDQDKPASCRQENFDE